MYWNHPGNACQDNEWWTPLVERRWAPTAARRPLLNLAAGTCQRWDSDGREWADHPATLAYARRFFDLSALTTVRDELSRQLLALAGRPAELLPCTSLFAAARLQIAPRRGEYIVLNYRRPSATDTFGAPVDAEAWERRFAAFAARLAATAPCLLVCHDQREAAAAQRLLPSLPHFYSPHYSDYLRIYAGARWGIVNRVHAGFALASLGKPAAIVGVDSRAHMASLIGLPAAFVDAADDAWLETTAAQLESATATYPAVIADHQQRAESRYLHLLRRALLPKGPP